VGGEEVGVVGGGEVAELVGGEGEAGGAGADVVGGEEFVGGGAAADAPAFAGFEGGVVGGVDVGVFEPVEREGDEGGGGVAVGFVDEEGGEGAVGLFFGDDGFSVVFDGVELVVVVSGEVVVGVFDGAGGVGEAEVDFPAFEGFGGEGEGEAFGEAVAGGAGGAVDVIAVDA
jgi:hypothetical protein